MVAVLPTDTGITDRPAPSPPAVLEFVGDVPVDVEVIVDVLTELDDRWTVTTFVVGVDAEALEGSVVVVGVVVLLAGVVSTVMVMENVSVFPTVPLTDVAVAAAGTSTDAVALPVRENSRDKEELVGEPRRLELPEPWDDAESAVLVKAVTPASGDSETLAL